MDIAPAVPLHCNRDCEMIQYIQDLREYTMGALEQYDACIEQKRAGNAAQSKDMLRQMIVDFPDFPLAYNALAALYKKEGNIELALEYIEKYCALEPADPFGFSILSSYCIAAGQRNKAEEALARASELQFKLQFGTK